MYRSDEGVHVGKQRGTNERRVRDDAKVSPKVDVAPDSGNYTRSRKVID